MLLLIAKRENKHYGETQMPQQEGVRTQLHRAWALTGGLGAGLTGMAHFRWDAESQGNCVIRLSINLTCRREDYSQNRATTGNKVDVAHFNQENRVCGVLGWGCGTVTCFLYLECSYELPSACLTLSRSQSSLALHWCSVISLDVYVQAHFWVSAGLLLFCFCFSPLTIKKKYGRDFHFLLEGIIVEF